MKENTRKVLRGVVGFAGSKGAKELFKAAFKKAAPLVVVVAAPAPPPLVLVAVVGVAGGFAARKAFDHFHPPS